MSVQIAYLQKTAARAGNSTVKQNDDVLMARIANADPGAFRELSKRHQGASFALAHRLVGTREEAEDIVQEAFLRVWRKAPEWETGRARFSTWLYRVVTNLAIDRLRKVRPSGLEAVDELVDTRPSADTTLQRRQKADEVRAALAQLPPRQRAAIVLTYYDELSNKEAAEVLDISVKALESLLVRGRRALHAMLAEDRVKIMETIS